MPHYPLPSSIGYPHVLAMRQMLHQSQKHVKITCSGLGSPVAVVQDSVHFSRNAIVKKSCRNVCRTGFLCVCVCTPVAKELYERVRI